MLEVADVSVANATREGDSPHHPVAFERPADPRVGAKLAEVPGGEIGGRLQLIRGRPGDQVDRSADGVASIQGALRPAQHLDAIEIEKLHELHRRPSEVDAVEIHRRTGIRSGIDDVRADPADRELTETGVLRKRDRRGERSRLIQRRSTQALELGVRDGTDRHRRIACTSLAPTFAAVTIVSSADGDVQGEGHADPFASLHAHGAMRPLESAQLRGDLIVAFRKVWKREVARGVRFPPCGRRHPESSCERRAAGHQSGRRSNRTPLRWAARAAGAGQRTPAPGPRRSAEFLRSHAKMYIIPPNVRGSLTDCAARALARRAGQRCGVRRSCAGGPTGAGAAIVRPRQPDCRLIHRPTSVSNWTSAPGHP